MGYEDTVMSQHAINEVDKQAIEKYCSIARPFSESAMCKAGLRAVAQTQAKITWDIAHETGYKKGIREFVEACRI